MMHTFPQKTASCTTTASFNSTIWNDFQFRDDDIAIPTYAKSGTTWVQQSSRSSFFQALTASKLLRCRRGWICVFRRRKSNSLDFMSRVFHSLPTCALTRLSHLNELLNLLLLARRVILGRGSFLRLPGCKVFC